MIPGKHDFTVWRGTSGPTQGLVVRLKTRDPESDELVALPFEDVRLSIYKKNELLLRESVVEGTGKLYVSDEYQSEITWAPSPEDTRLIPIGTKAQYELEIWNGFDEIVYLYGDITGQGGINDDQPEAS